VWVWVWGGEAAGWAPFFFTVVSGGAERWWHCGRHGRAAKQHAVAD